MNEIRWAVLQSALICQGEPRRFLSMISKVRILGQYAVASYISVGSASCVLASQC